MHHFMTLSAPTNDHEDNNDSITQYFVYLIIIFLSEWTCLLMLPFFLQKAMQSLYIKKKSRDEMSQILYINITNCIT